MDLQRLSDASLSAVDRDHGDARAAFANQHNNKNDDKEGK